MIVRRPKAKLIRSFRNVICLSNVARFVEEIFFAITGLNLDRKRSFGQTLFSVLSPEGTQGYDFRMVRARAEIFAIKAGSRTGQQRKKGRGEEWSEGDERHGRLSREVAVEHRGSDRDTTRNQRSDPGDCLQPPCSRAGDPATQMPAKRSDADDIPARTRLASKSLICHD